jgi:[ribosomal protein S5]-alanine N-acetyltransferase
MIKGEGFILRPFRLTDKKSLAKHANNIKISDNLRDKFPHPYTEEGRNGSSTLFYPIMIR